MRPIVVGQLFTTYREPATTPMTKRQVHGGSYYGAKVDAAEVKTALHAAFGCFVPTLSKDKWKRVESVSQVCAADAMVAAERVPLTAAVFKALATK